MKLSGSAIISEVYYSEKSDTTHITAVPDSGGLVRFAISGRVEGDIAGKVLQYDGEVKLSSYKNNIRIEIYPEFMKVGNGIKSQ